MIVDTSRQGSGTSNCGNTARRFFSDPELAAEISGVDKTLIERFGWTLKKLASSKPVDVDCFEKYAFETAELFVTLYPWFYMPASVHKILIHGAKVMKCFHLPIGQYTEEAAEARKKDFKHIRKGNTRKISRTAMNEDLAHKLMVSSDPVVVSKRQQTIKALE